MKKVFLLGLLSGLAMLVFGMLFDQGFNWVFPGLTSEYETSGVFRAWTEPLMSLYFLSPFVMGIAFAWTWNKTKSLFKGSIWKRALMFSLALFFVTTVPGMFISYASFKISLLMIASWTLSSFVQEFVGGLVLAKMNK
ncbi:MAG: hypothetical protein US89_C0019G0007 [Candidatus Peregrinibacteria bacterium GW2011_GWF2_38_29]|nr:MAG: hypothetical protein US89_C0019G0007 [Candidatus Peregrinibacteria bacterium GW2011_GWF2_38_29]HBB02438.1 hypothetical protein [Candidatus Peregrinibacteria bacterium]